MFGIEVFAHEIATCLTLVYKLNYDIASVKHNLGVVFDILRAQECISVCQQQLSMQSTSHTAVLSHDDMGAEWKSSLGN